LFGEVKRICPVCSDEVPIEKEYCDFCGHYMGLAESDESPESHESSDLTSSEPVDVHIAIPESVEPPPKIHEPAPPLSDETPSLDVCVKCGKELQADWVACPYCRHLIEGILESADLPREEPAPAVSPPSQTVPAKPISIVKPALSKSKPMPRQLNAESWGKLLEYIVGTAILSGAVGGLGGILIGAVGSWTQAWPIVGALLGGGLGLTWFGFGALLSAKSLPNVVAGRDVPISLLAVIVSLPIAGFGTWLATIVGLYNGPWDGALWLGLGSMSMGALIGAGIGLTPKQK